MKTFAELFKKYRLKAEFETFATFGNALSEKGYYYEDSIFSHWQKGTRIPNNRQLILTILQIFIEKGAISSEEEANEFIESTKSGFLTAEEKEKFHINQLTKIPFQVPSETAHFSGREEIIDKIKQELTSGKTFLLHGPPGVGKTAMAIHLGYVLKDKFPDGVLWYKVDSSNIMDILLSMAHLFGEDISTIKDGEVRASILRTLLSKRKLLLFFDNVTKNDKIHILLPGSPSCCVIFTSQESSLHIPSEYTSIKINVLTHQETLLLYKKIFNKIYVSKHKKDILALGKKVGNLPLAVNLIATYLKKFGISPQEYLLQLNTDSLYLKSLTYEDKNLSRTISISFNKLDTLTKNIFVSLGVFEGKDFSVEAIAFVNNTSVSQAEKILQQLMDISFVEKSSDKRFRIHPLLRVFAREQIKDSLIYLRAAFYYEQVLNSSHNEYSRKVLMQEVDNIIYVFKKCYEYEYWDQIITLWNPIEKMLSNNNEIKKLRSLAQTIDTTPKINNLQKILTIFTFLFLIYWGIFYFGYKPTLVMKNIISLLVGIIALLDGFVGIIVSKPWGIFKTNIGKAILFISTGSFLWGVGGVMWGYYNFFLNIAVPYPSYADLAYFPGSLSWVIGIIYLSRATGAKIEIRKKKAKLFLLIIPFIIMIFSYYFILFVVKGGIIWSTPIKTFFDLAYPSIDIIILTIAFIIFGLSVNFLGGKYKLSIFAILLGFVCMFVADFIISYKTSLNMEINAGISDMIFTVSFYLLTWGALSFYLTPRKTIVKY